MSLADVEHEIIEPMQQLFTVPHPFSDEQRKQAMRQYGDALQAFSRSDLHEAWNEVRDTYRYRTWPPVAIFVLAARKARNAREPEIEKRKWQESFATFQANWDAIKTLPVARLAAAQGWSWSLKCAVLDGQIKSEGQVNVAAFESNHRRCERNEERVKRGEPMVSEGGAKVVMRPEFAETYLKGRDSLRLQEAETAQEIADAQTPGHVTNDNAP